MRKVTRCISELRIWWKCVWSFYQSTRMRNQLLYIRTCLRHSSHFSTVHHQYSRILRLLRDVVVFGAFSAWRTICFLL